MPGTKWGLEHDAEREPNNTPSTAAPVELGTTAAARLTPVSDENDHYTFPVNDGTTYTLTLSALKCPLLSGSNFALFAYLGPAGSNAPEREYTQVFAAKGTYIFPATHTGEELLRIYSPRSCAYELTVE